MPFLSRLPGLLLGLAAGAAVYYLTRDKDPESRKYEHIVGPEDVVEVDEDEDEAEEEPEAEPEPRPQATEPEPQTAPAAQVAAPVENGTEEGTKKTEPSPDGENTPNANPVTRGTAEVPKTKDGKLDATKIADPADFGDWDEEGCRG